MSQTITSIAVEYQLDDKDLEKKKKNWLIKSKTEKKQLFDNEKGYNELSYEKKVEIKKSKKKTNKKLLREFL